MGTTTYHIQNLILKERAVSLEAALLLCKGSELE
nr:MAG TPA: hypothetical protein [Caudoviricetes sp.]